MPRGQKRSNSAVSQAVPAENIEEASVGEGMRSRKKFTWRLATDISLAKTVAERAPYKLPPRAGKQIWMEIATEINHLFNSDVDYLGAQRHFELMMKYHRKKETENRYASGKEEDVTELDHLLSDLMEQIDDHNLQNQQETETKQKKVDEQKAKAAEIREAAATTMKNRVEEDGAPQKRLSDHSLVSLYTKRQDAEDERERKNKELDLQKLELQKEENAKDRNLKVLELKISEDRVKLEREMFEHKSVQEEQEFQLRQRQLEIQEEERKSQLKTQETLLQLLLKKL